MTGTPRRELRRADAADAGTSDPESKLAAVDQLLREWADEPATDLVSLLELVERIRRVVTS